MKLYLAVPLMIILLGASMFLLLKRSDTPEVSPKVATAEVEPSQVLTPTPKKNLVSEIKLDIASPTEGMIATSPTIVVKGMTVPYGEVFINDTETEADGSGLFREETTLDEGENLINIIANDENGNYSETVITVFLEPDDIHEREELKEVVIVSEKGAELTVEKNKKEITVKTDKNTTFRKNLWEKSTFAELSVNDTVTIWGSWKDEEKNILQARLIRDFSVQRQTGIFFGIIKELSKKEFVLNIPGVPTQTVHIGRARILNKRGNLMSLNSLEVGNKVRIRGVRDHVNNTITDVMEIKDFSVISKALTPTPIPTEIEEEVLEVTPEEGI